jgi:aminotransferase
MKLCQNGVTQKAQFTLQPISQTTHFINNFSFLNNMTHLSERELELPDAMIGKLLGIAAERKDIISLGPGEPDFPAPKPIVEHTKKIASKVNHYAPPGGFLQLREAICKKLKKQNNIQATPNNIVVTAGSQEAMLLAGMCTLDINEQMLIPNPGFLAYIPLNELIGAVPVNIQLKEENNFVINPDDVKKAITKKTQVLLINTPSNPTGNVIPKKIQEELADIAVEHDLTIFSDEAYEYITYDTKHHSIASLNGMEDHIVSFYTFSKSYAMCGYRLGYAVGPEDLIAAMTKIHIESSICAPTISQHLGIKALSMNPKIHIAPMINEYNRRRKLITKRLNDMNLPTPTPQGAFYAFSNISHIQKNSRKFALDLLKKAKVAVVPGSEFGKYGEGYIRCSYATSFSLIKKAMDRMESYINRK